MNLSGESHKRHYYNKTLPLGGEGGGPSLSPRCLWQQPQKCGCLIPSGKTHCRYWRIRLGQEHSHQRDTSSYPLAAFLPLLEEANAV